MLRPLLLALLGANLLFYAWSQGWLGGRGAGEPQRLASQVRPEWVRVLPPAASAQGDARAQDPASAASAQAGAEPVTEAGTPAPATPGALAGGPGTACLEAGPLDGSRLTTAEAALRLAGLPERSWAVVADTSGGQWLRVQAADAAQRSQLERLREEEVSGGFKPCRVP